MFSYDKSFELFTDKKELLNLTTGGPYTYSQSGHHFYGTGTTPYYGSDKPTSKQKEGSDYIALLYFLKQASWINFTNYIYNNYSNNLGYDVLYTTSIRTITVDTTYSNVIIYIPRYMGMNNCVNSAVSFNGGSKNHQTTQPDAGGSGYDIEHNTVVSEFIIKNTGTNKIIFLCTAIYPDKNNYRDKNYDYYGEQTMTDIDRKEDRPPCIVNNKHVGSGYYSSNSSSINLKFKYTRHYNDKVKTAFVGNSGDSISYYVTPNITDPS